MRSLVVFCILFAAAMAAPQLYNYPLVGRWISGSTAPAVSRQSRLDVKSSQVLPASAAHLVKLPEIDDDIVKEAQAKANPSIYSPLIVAYGNNAQFGFPTVLNAPLTAYNVPSPVGDSAIVKQSRYDTETWVPW